MGNHIGALTTLWLQLRPRKRWSLDLVTVAPCERVQAAVTKAVTRPFFGSRAEDTVQDAGSSKMLLFLSPSGWQTDSSAVSARVCMCRIKLGYIRSLIILTLTLEASHDERYEMGKQRASY